ncbi:TonB family protein [Hymenobacter algoricola]|uniref:TonB C-terminal domain-containing protein n=1 Tax=Hymenobacter algoricola TaxID=486267 RepID=A0ABP7NEV4_9BACT
MSTIHYCRLAGALLLSVGSFAGFAQRRPAVPAAQLLQKPAPKVYTYVEQMPSFPGGLVRLNEYLQKNSRYGAQLQRVAPKDAHRVFVRFLIEPDGQLTHVELLKGTSAAYDEEALRLVQAMPRWTPGRQNGQPVTVEHTLLLSFGKP